MTYYFIGIKGAGMSSLAQIMHDLGYKVEGSDKDRYYFTEEGLKERGIPYYIFNEKNIHEGLIIVQGNAFGDENVEVAKAKELGLEIRTYQEMIDAITKEKKLIAISGCHGKTTTTTMMAKVFENVGVNYLIGDGSGYAIPENDYFALEACEYKRHFLAYHPYYAVITNIELDHTDYYKDLDDMIDAYNHFADAARKMVIMWGDDPNIGKLKTKNEIFTYGFEEQNNVVAKNIKVQDEKTICDIYVKGEFYGNFTLPFVGDHMVLNYLAVVCVAYLENMDINELKSQTLKIKHAKRRFIEEKFKSNIIIDDYAHHPTEIKVTILAAKKKYPDKKIIAIFKAHTRSRVQYFSQEFADALNLADKVYVLDIGEDRIENGYDGVNCFDIINKLNNGEYINLDQAEKLVPYKNSVLLFMSSKDIYYLEDKYKELANKNEE